MIKHRIITAKELSLHETIACGNIKKTKELLAFIKNGSELDTFYDKFGQAPIHTAVILGVGYGMATQENIDCSLQILELLFEKGANVNALTQNKKYSAISLTLVWKHNITILQFLLTKGANPDQHLIQNRSTIIPDGDFYTIEEKCTALHIAAGLPENDALLVLLAFTRNPNPPLSDGTTPLHVAIFAMQEKTTLALLSHIDINLECTKRFLGMSKTPLQMAVYLISPKQTVYYPTNWREEPLYRIVKCLTFSNNQLNEQVTKILENQTSSHSILTFVQELNQKVSNVQHKPYPKATYSLSKNTTLLLLKWRLMVQYDSRQNIFSLLKKSGHTAGLFKSLLSKEMFESSFKYCFVKQCNLNKEEKTIFNKFPNKILNTLSEAEVQSLIRSVYFLRNALDTEYVFYRLLNETRLSKKSKFSKLPQELLDKILEYTLIEYTMIERIHVFQDIATTGYGANHSIFPR